MAIQSSMSWKLFPDFVLVVCHGSGIDDGEFVKCLDEVRANHRDKIVVMARSAMLTATQRQNIAKATKELKARGAIHLNSAITRGAVTALSWILGGDTFKAFDVDDVESGIRWLGASTRHAPEAERFIRESDEKSRQLRAGNKVA